MVANLHFQLDISKLLWENNPDWSLCICFPMKNTVIHFEHEKTINGFFRSMGLPLASLQGTGALPELIHFFLSGLYYLLSIAVNILIFDWKPSFLHNLTFYINNWWWFSKLQAHRTKVAMLNNDLSLWSVYRKGQCYFFQCSLLVSCDWIPFLIQMQG